jgi:hypothetical protein
LSFDHQKGTKIYPRWVVNEAFYTQNIPKMRLFWVKIAAQPRKYRVRNGGHQKKSKILISPKEIGKIMLFFDVP